MVGLVIYDLYWQALPQPLALVFPVLPEPKAADRILVLSPHPDDETLGAAGFITASVNAKANVWVALVTDGNKHGKEQVRYAEFDRVMGLLGVPTPNRIFLGYPDGGLESVNQTDLQTRFQTIIDQAHPTIVLVPHSHDSHPDHRATGKAADALLKGSSIRVYHYLVHYPHFPFPQKFVPDNYLLPPLRLISTQEQWYRQMLGTQTSDQKLEALLQYKSQLKNPFLRKLFDAFIRQNELYSWSGSPV